MYTVIGITPEGHTYIGRHNGKTCCTEEKTKARSFAVCCKNYRPENRFFVGRISLNKNEACPQSFQKDASTSEESSSNSDGNGNSSDSSGNTNNDWERVAEAPKLPDGWLVGFPRKG